MAARKRTILLIDDDVDYAFLVTEVLSRRDYEVHHERSPFEAVMSARRLYPDVIMLDLEMPGKGGREVLDDLWAHPDTQGIPVVIVSGSDVRLEERLEGIKRGVAAYFSKPMNLADIDGALQGIIQMTQRIHGFTDRERTSLIHSTGRWLRDEVFNLVQAIFLEASTLSGSKDGAAAAAGRNITEAAEAIESVIRRLLEAHKVTIEEERGLPPTINLEPKRKGPSEPGQTP